MCDAMLTSDDVAGVVKLMATSAHLAEVEL